jgi:hypothetical protein
MEHTGSIHPLLAVVASPGIAVPPVRLGWPVELEQECTPNWEIIISTSNGWHKVGNDGPYSFFPAPPVVNGQRHH